MNVWQTLIGTLALRPPPTLDEIKDLKRSEGNTARLAALREVKAIEGAAKIAATEKGVLGLVMNHKKTGITFVELAEQMHVTVAYARVVTRRMEIDGRLRHEIGAGGRKLWFLK